MGQPKALLRHQGVSLLRHAAQSAVDSGCRPVVVVLGASADRLLPELDGLDVKWVENPHWQEGLSTSLRVGLNALGPVDAVLITVCDQPLVSSELLGEIVAAYHDQSPEVVASEYDGTLGVPALFSRSLFPEILALSGDRGAKSVLQAHAEGAVRIQFPQGAVDIDTRDDYERLTGAGNVPR